MVVHELLAPAGDLERLKVAIMYGADAVYLGGPSLGLRANANNFTIEEIKEGVEFAHSYHKKVYVTVNIALHNKEANGLVSYLKELEQCQVDAIIVSDGAIMESALKNTNLEVHVSTQASTLNIEAAKFYKKLGVKRIVLGRELSKEEIKEIIDNVDIDVECFIHGAMCAGYSGRCVLSNFLTARDANRGGCSQICRWDFNLLNEDKKELVGDKEFTFCTKDLSMLKYIPDMIDMGISSFKIEGRMRSIYYIATVVGVYRKAIDAYLQDPTNYKYDKNLEMILDNCANRDSIPQFFDGVYDERVQYYNGRVEVSNQDFLGLVIDYQDGIVTLEQRNFFKKGDVVEIFGPKMDTINLVIPDIYDIDGNLLDAARHPRQIIKFKIDKKVEPYYMMRIKR